MKKNREVLISVVVKLNAQQKGVDAGATQRRGSVVFIVFVSIVVTSKGESSCGSLLSESERWCV